MNTTTSLLCGYGNSNPTLRSSEETSEDTILKSSDPQRSRYAPPTFEYIQPWYNSIHQHTDITGVVFENMFNKSFRAKYADKQVSFVTTNTSTHPAFVDIKDSLTRSINDQRYIVYEWYLNNTYPANDTNNTNRNHYILLSDGRDVEFLKNPFEYMQTIDRLLGAKHLFVGSEWDPKKQLIQWLTRMWLRCFDEPYPYNSTIFNAGIIGGHISVVKKVLRSMNDMFLSEVVPVDIDCNMAVLEKTVHTLFRDIVVTGYPFHTKFTHYEKESLAYIQHQ
ncbi:hypothetical protein ACA910_004591 [Epithemia clementina (nom. ined.)]